MTLAMIFDEVSGFYRACTVGAEIDAAVDAMIAVVEQDTATIALKLVDLGESLILRFRMVHSVFTSSYVSLFYNEMLLKESERN